MLSHPTVTYATVCRYRQAGYSTLGCSKYKNGRKNFSYVDHIKRSDGSTFLQKYYQSNKKGLTAS